MRDAYEDRGLRSRPRGGRQSSRDAGAVVRPRRPAVVGQQRFSAAAAAPSPKPTGTRRSGRASRPGPRRPSARRRPPPAPHVSVDRGGIGARTTRDSDPLHPQRLLAHLPPRAAARPESSAARDPARAATAASCRTLGWPVRLTGRPPLQPAREASAWRRRQAAPSCRRAGPTVRDRQASAVDAGMEQSRHMLDLAGRTTFSSHRRTPCGVTFYASGCRGPRPPHPPGHRSRALRRVDGRRLTTCASASSAA